MDPIELTPPELGPLFAAANENNWGYVQPVIFGTLFEGSLGKEERHALGAHFTYESDIQKIVRATIVRPWDERIAAAKTAAELVALLKELRRFRVLDPACGCGNFLFVAYRALREIEQRLLLRLFALDKRQFAKVGLASGISLKNFFGIDVNENAVETAKVTLMLARRLAHREAEQFWEDHADELPGQDTHSLEFERDLPLDNLDANIVCADALFTPWPEVEAIIGNPPYLGSRYVAQGTRRTNMRRTSMPAFPDVPRWPTSASTGSAWRMTVLKPGGRAGLVGTNTIRQNESREARLDYIVGNGGTITEAVSHQVWSGEAAVHVSIVNWIKGEQPRRAPRSSTPSSVTRRTVHGNARKSRPSVPRSPANTDVSSAQGLRANQEPKRVFQGQNPVNEGFFLEPEEAARNAAAETQDSRESSFPYMIGDDLLRRHSPPVGLSTSASATMDQAMHYHVAFEQREERWCMPDVLAKAEKEKAQPARTATRWTRLAERWWQFRDYQPRDDAPPSRGCLATSPAARVTKRPIFEFICVCHPPGQHAHRLRVR